MSGDIVNDIYKIINSNQHLNKKERKDMVDEICKQYSEHFTYEPHINCSESLSLDDRYCKCLEAMATFLMSDSDTV